MNQSLYRAALKAHFQSLNPPRLLQATSSHNLCLGNKRRGGKGQASPRYGASLPRIVFWCCLRHCLVSDNSARSISKDCPRAAPTPEYPRGSLPAGEFQRMTVAPPVENNASKFLRIGSLTTTPCWHFPRLVCLVSLHSFKAGLFAWNAVRHWPIFYASPH